MTDLVETLVGILILVVSIAGTWVITHHVVATECEKLGAFYVGDKVYECKLKGTT